MNGIHPDNIQITYKDFASLELIRELWQKLNEHHRRGNSCFEQEYARRKFDERKEELLAKSAGGKTILILAQDKSFYIGYCAASVDPAGNGEIDSLFLESAYRGQNIGERLMQAGLDWLQGNNARKIKIVVYAGNENVIKFYQKFGFEPRNIVLERPLKDEK